MMMIIMTTITSRSGSVRRTERTVQEVCMRPAQSVPQQRGSHRRTEQVQVGHAIVVRVVRRRGMRRRAAAAARGRDGRPGRHCLRQRP